MKDSCNSSKMMPSCKWPIINQHLEYQSRFTRPSLGINHYIPAVYSSRCSYSVGKEVVSIWIQGLVDVSGRSARVIIKCSSRFRSIKSSDVSTRPSLCVFNFPTELLRNHHFAIHAVTVGGITLIYYFFYYCFILLFPAAS